MTLPGYRRQSRDDMERRYDGPIPKDAGLEYNGPSISHTVKQIEAARERCRERCRTRWLTVKACARLAIISRNEPRWGNSARIKFDIACRLMKEDRLIRDAWETAWRDRLCLPEAEDGK